MPFLPSWLGGGGSTVDTAGQVVPLGGGLGMNSLMGLGLGLMSGTRTDPYGNAMTGFAAGSRADQDAAYRAELIRDREADRKRQAERDKILDARYMAEQAENKRRWEADRESKPSVVFNEGTPYLVDPRNREMPVRPLEGGQGRKLDAHTQTQIDKADEAYSANRDVISTLGEMRNLNKNTLVGTGYLQERAKIGANIPFTDNTAARNTLKLNQLSTGVALEQLRATFGGNPTEGERKVLIQMQSAMDLPADDREELYARAQKLAEQRLELNRQRGQQLRGGTYYRQGGGPTGDNAAGKSPGAVRRYNAEKGIIE